MSTLASEGPTREITSSTGRMAAEWAINWGNRSARRTRFSASRRWPLRSARPSSICVLRMAERRALSHGFWMKSRAPRRMASTASSTEPHAVITITGRVESRRLDAVEQLEPFLPGSGVAGVVEVHQHDVEVARFDGVDGGGGRVHALGLVAFAFDQEAERFENIGLIVGDENRGRAGVG